MASITNISKIDGGFTYTFDVDSVDVWLNGELLAENLQDTSYTYYTQASIPPPIQICDYGARCTNAWASSTMRVQWFTETYTSFAITEYRAGVEYETTYHDVPFPNRYETVEFSIESTVAQVWSVRPCIKYDPDKYVIVGNPVQVTMNQYVLPDPPLVEYGYNESTRILTISESRGL